MHEHLCLGLDLYLWTVCVYAPNASQCGDTIVCALFIWRGMSWAVSTYNDMFIQTWTCVTNLAWSHRLIRIHSPCTRLSVNKSRILQPQNAQFKRDWLLCHEVTLGITCLSVLATYNKILVSHYILWFVHIHITAYVLINSLAAGDTDKTQVGIFMSCTYTHMHAYMCVSTHVNADKAQKEAFMSCCVPMRRQINGETGLTSTDQVCIHVLTYAHTCTYACAYTYT